MTSEEREEMLAEIAALHVKLDALLATNEKIDDVVTNVVPEVRGQIEPLIKSISKHPMAKFLGLS